MGVVPDVVELLELLELELELELEFDEPLVPPEPLVVLDELELLELVEEVPPEVDDPVDELDVAAGRYITERTSTSMRRRMARANSARSTSSCPEEE